MVKWREIVKEWKYEKPRHFWTHWFHDVYDENRPWWEHVRNPKCLCRTCKVWWQKES